MLVLALAVGALATGAATLHAQTGVVTGRVTDPKSGDGIPSVAVQIEGTKLGTLTAIDGRYRIAGVPVGSRAVTARRIGYTQARQAVTVPAGSEVTADFTLQAGAVELNQVVVTGTAGVQELRSVGNAVSILPASQIQEVAQSPTVSSLIEGRASGVTVLERSGRLGTGPTIEIRGRSSLSLDNSPLIYIDGVRVNNSTATGPSSGGLGGQGSQFAGRLNDIDPEDIESIEIIKGPAAATIYGTEAANGVVQIITKRGAGSARPQFGLQVEEGSMFFRDAANRVPTNYMKDKNGNVVAWNGIRQEDARGTPVYRTGMSRHYNGTLSGSRDQLRYYFSAGYMNDYGIEPNNSLRQANLHGNVDVSVNSRTDFSLSVNYVDLSAHLGADYGASPLLGMEVGHALLFPAARGFYPNFPPELEQQLYDNADGINRFTASGTISNRLTNWFSQRAIVGIDYTGEDARGIEHYATPTLAQFLTAAAASGRITQTLRHNSIITADYSGSAKFNLRPTIASTTTVGGQFYKTELNQSVLAGTGFPAPGVETISATATQAPTQTETINTTIGGYVDQQFGWRDRLFIDGALRVDNNSAFGQNFKWVTYPKVSGSWVVSEEPFWHWTKAINTLRLRAAYGESGRQPAAFSALRTFSTVVGPGGVTTVTPDAAGNPDLKPEHSRELEMGFESGFFQRLTFNFTYFNKRTFDEIVSQGVAPSSGFYGTTGQRLVNLGEVTNHGIELEGRFNAVDRRNFAWDITGTYGTNHDEIKRNIPTSVPSAGQYNIVGYPIGGIFTRRVVSADRDPATGQATNILCDGGAGSAPVACASAPFVFIGTPTPKYSGSIGNTFTLFKRLTVYGLLDFKGGNLVENANELLRCTGAVGVGLCDVNYNPTRYSTTYVAEATGTALSRGYVDQYYQDGGFVKLREVSVTYAIPERWIGGFSRASLTLAGRDLHTWTNYRGIDPEVNAANPATSATTLDQALTPPLTRFIATLNLKW